MTPAEASHVALAARILGELTEEIEALGERLCRDPVVIGGHGTELQAIDLIAQKQRWLAHLLLADCPHTAAAEIGVEELRVRFGEYLDRNAA